MKPIVHPTSQIILSVFGHKLSFMDCYLLSALAAPCADLEGLAFVPADIVMADAEEKFGCEIDDAIEASKTTLLSVDLVRVKESSSGVVNIGLTKECLRVANEMLDRLRVHFAATSVCYRNDNPLLNSIKWA